jgi:hypothetical protein
MKDSYVQSLRYAVKATQHPNAEVVRQIVLHCPSGPRVSADDFLHACKTRSLEIVKNLLSEGGVNVNKGTIQTLPLHVAIKTSDTAIFGAVLDAGADINKTDYSETMPRDYCDTPVDKQNPLEFAAVHSLIALKYLLERGAVVRHVDFWYWLPDKESYDVLRKARMKRTGGNVPTFSKSQDQIEKELEAYAQSEEERLEKVRGRLRG